MKDTIPITFINPDAGAMEIPLEIAKQIGVVPGDDKRGEMKTFGPWQIPISYRAVATSTRFNRQCCYTKVLAKTIWGVRTMVDPKESGYQLEGRCSVMGKKRRAFTSGMLLRIDGKLSNVATIHVCAVEDKQ